MYQMSPAQQAQACQQARAAALQRRQAEQAAAQAQALEAQRAADHANAVAAAKAAAEASPSNLCREPSTASVLIKSYNGLEWEGWPKRHVVDIEHLVTPQNESDKQFLVCHGLWVHGDGMRLEGTMTMRLNVANEMIVTWKPERWVPSVPDLPPSVPAVAPASAPQTPAPELAKSAAGGPGTTFEQGLADRRAWEAWFAAATGEYKSGALYWSGQRSLAHPGSCAVLGGGATAGCLAAQARLSPADARRRTEPEYRAGWNSLQASLQ